MNKVILCLAVLLCAQASTGIFHGLLFRPFIRLALIGKNPTEDQITAIQQRLLSQTIPVFPGTPRFKLLTWYYYDQMFGSLAAQQATSSTTSAATTTTTAAATTTSEATTTTAEATSTTAAASTTTQSSSTTP